MRSLARIHVHGGSMYMCGGKLTMGIARWRPKRDVECDRKPREGGRGAMEGKDVTGGRANREMSLDLALNGGQREVTAGSH